VPQPLPSRRNVLVQALCLALAAYLLVPANASAQRGAQTIPADLDDLVQTAAIIVRGTVVSASVEPHPEFPNLRTVVVTVSVARVLKGPATATYTFRQFIWDAQDADDAAGYRKAGELLLFLNPVSPYGLTSPVGLAQGRFRVIRDSHGKKSVMNGHANVGLFHQVVSKAASKGVALSPQARAMMAKPSGQVPLAVLEDTVVALAGASR
jgi:hypothetical protein